MKYILTILFLGSLFCFGKKPSPFSIPGLAPKDSAVLLMLPKEIQPFSVRDFALSPKQDELFITVESNKNVFSSILHLTKDGKKWKVELASFSGKYSDIEPTFTPDGNTLYFVSNRPLQKDSAVKDFDIWKTEKIKGVWSEPENLGAPINTDANEFYPAVTTNGKLYFTAAYKEKAVGKEDIWVSSLENGKYTQPLVLPETVNSRFYEFNAFVSPDDSYIIFTSFGREDDLGGGDLYISKKDAKGDWLPAKNLGENINSKGLDYCPFVSFDKKYFFFTSDRNSIQKSYKTKLSLDTFLKEIGQLQNGKGNIYWIDADEVLR
ncbi:MAG: PD40 domain-containing protein [Chitinophagales bacterium]|nr:PD40 domain-containing protein [Chitinophagales bacterium]